MEMWFIYCSELGKADASNKNLNHSCERFGKADTNHNNLSKRMHKQLEPEKTSTPKPNYPKHSKPFKYTPKNAESVRNYPHHSLIDLNSFGWYFRQRESVNSHNTRSQAWLRWISTFCARRKQHRNRCFCLIVRLYNIHTHTIMAAHLIQKSVREM